MRRVAQLPELPLLRAIVQLVLAAPPLICVHVSMALIDAVTGFALKGS
jgi:hypothetical protein